MHFNPSRFRNIFPFLVLSLAAGACSCDEKRTKLNQATSVPTQVLLEGDSHVFDALGETLRPTITVTNQIGEVMSGVTLRWSTSDDAVVKASEDGLLTSTGNGEATVEIRAGEGARAHLAVTVRQRAVEVQVEPERLHFESIGETGRLLATARDRNGHPIEDAAFLWSSKDEAVATVDFFGSVEAVGEGATDAVAQVEGSEASGHAPILVAPAPTTLRFHFSRPHWIAGTSTEVQVEILDPAGHRITGANQDLHIGLGENFSGGTLTGTLIQRAANGLAVFPDLRIDKAGKGYTLIVGDGALEGESEPFDVVAGAASRLRFVRQPVDTAAGVPLPAVQVQIEDAWGNRIPGATHQVELALDEAPTDLGGSSRVAAADGLAAFEDLRIERAAPAYHLTASAQGWSSARSEAFAIHPAAPAGLVWLDEPRDAASGADIGPVRAAVVDAFGNTARYAGKVAVELLPEDTEARLSGETEIDAAEGLAHFGPLRVDRVGTYELALRAGALGPYQSRSFSIHAGVPAKLRFVTSPSGGVRNETLARSEVEALDEAGNRSDEALEISLTLLGGPGALHGSKAKTAVQGVAAFGDLHIDKAGTGYRLEASAAGLNAVPSPSFDVSACRPQRTDCNGICVDTRNDDANCGACGKVCSVDQSCFGGACTCDELGLEACGTACVDLETDPDHCGNCVTACRSDQICDRGSCACPAGSELCGGTCVDTRNEPAHCGRCNKACDPGFLCDNGVCSLPCPAGQAICGGVCVDTQRDPLHCGDCVTACNPNDLCSSGRCMPDPEYANWPVPDEAVTAANYDSSTYPGIVLDLTTRLMWERSPTNTRYTWANAPARCQGLTLGGYSDWRVPTMVELSSILAVVYIGAGNLEYPRTNPAIISAAFLNTNWDYSNWTASEFKGNTSQAWAVNFGSGILGQIPKTNAAYVRCVRYGPGYRQRSEMPAARYTNGGAGNSAYVKDNYTGLMWQNADFYTGTFLASYQNCRNRFYGGYSAWMPGRRELTTLIDVRRTNPSFNDTVFARVLASDGFWTQTYYGTQSGQDLYWYMDFGQSLFGYSSQYANNLTFRCVAP